MRPYVELLRPLVLIFLPASDRNEVRTIFVEKYHSRIVVSQKLLPGNGNRIRKQSQHCCRSQNGQADSGCHGYNDVTPAMLSTTVVPICSRLQCKKTEIAVDVVGLYIQRDCIRTPLRAYEW